ncbi:transglutaminase family protein [Bosea sp. BK604]|uniref:transglutaminase-like domain-containing protein n=1 Tax=Bosea sp. BK604 TaxID=2512180 RepID=UPI00105139AB|nr:transglutaminase family protein [Bosea sp. BK604]TCR65699.1 transglutaminase-like putative cysteine protease [Bosea sp. BK604]
MKLTASAELVYEFTAPTQVIGLLQAAHSTDQTILSEELVLSPHAPLIEDESPQGDRRFRACLSRQTSIKYTATVDNGMRSLLPTAGRQHLWNELPADALPYLLPSRFCPSDSFQRFAQREFGGAGDGVARVMAILDWIAAHVDYVGGVSTPESTAAHTFTVRAGVCRDFTHLGITFCRALSIPARAVSAYSLDVQPPDFHAVMEIYLENAWWLVDPTRLAPIEGIIRIAHGRDAADTAFLTTDNTCTVVSQTVTVSRS